MKANKLRLEKLYTPLQVGFKLPKFVSLENRVIDKDASNIIFTYWPNDVPCIELNTYMITLWSRGYSLRNKGGSLRTYAREICHLLKYSYLNGTPFHQLTNDRFSFFIESLKSRDKYGNRIRDDNTVLGIGRRCLAFLKFLEKYYNMDNFVGEDNCIITATEKVIIIKKGKRKIKNTYWSHESFPEPIPQVKKHPIDIDAVEKIKKAAREVSDKALSLRKQCLIAMLEQTGGRRSEINDLTVNDIETAMESSSLTPKLRLVNLKSKNKKEKFIPVPRALIDLLWRYKKYYRQAIIDDKISKGLLKEDHGLFFISHTEGTPITDDTITSEISLLCILAGLHDTAAHGHLFRHGFITQKLVVIILQYEIKDNDEFRKKIIDTESFKAELLEWTGQSSISSLDRYINLAFSELTETKKIYDAILLKSATTVTIDKIKSIQNNLETNNSNSKATINELNNVLSSFLSDIEAAKSSFDNGKNYFK